ncbi:MAG: hypothetical protein V2A64_03655 [Candidatus Omnitrophota bacterium]
MEERRRLGRVRVPEAKLTCRILETERNIQPSDCLINDINANGFSFISDTDIEKDKVIKLRINFPACLPTEPNDIWGKVVYNCRIPEREKILIGVSLIRKAGTK